MRPSRSMVLLGAAVLGHLLLFAWFGEVGRWRGVEHEAWKLFRLGALACGVLVCAGSVVVRGAPQEKVAGLILCGLPGFVLAGAVWTLIRINVGP